MRKDFPKTRRELAQLIVRFCLMTLFLFIAVASPFTVGHPRPTPTAVSAAVSSVICVLIAAGIWFI